MPTALGAWAQRGSIDLADGCYGTGDAGGEQVEGRSCEGRQCTGDLIDFVRRDIELDFVDDLEISPSDIDVQCHRCGSGGIRLSGDG